MLYTSEKILAFFKYSYLRSTNNTLLNKAIYLFLFSKKIIQVSNNHKFYTK